MMSAESLSAYFFLQMAVILGSCRLAERLTRCNRAFILEFRLPRRFNPWTSTFIINASDALIVVDGRLGLGKSNLRIFLGWRNF